MIVKLAKLLPILALAVWLGGCASQEVEEMDPGVQDITPGEKSVLQQPATGAKQPAVLEERNI